MELEALGDVRVTLTVLVGRTTASIADVLAYAPGSIVTLDAAADAPVELFVNGISIASGDLVSLDDGSLAVQIKTLFRPDGAARP